MQFVGLLLIVNSLAGGAWWIASGRPQFAVVPICVAALLAGVFLLRQDRVKDGATAGEPRHTVLLEELVVETAKAKILLADLQDQTAVADWHLQQLDDHLQATHILPDGRAKIGAAVTGQAIVLIPRLEALQKLSTERPADAYPVARECVTIYETTREQIREAMFVGGDLGAETIAWLYATAATAAQRVGEHDQSLEWARAAVQERPSAERQFLLITALINKNLQAEANELIKAQLKAGGTEAARFRELLNQYKIPHQ